MADDATTTTFRRNHLVRLRGFNHAALDGKLVRVGTNLRERDGKHGVVFLDDTARPPVPVLPERRMLIQPEHMRHACEYCLVVAADGVKLHMCGRCKSARYCNAVCQHADWGRHKAPDCFQFSHERGCNAPLHQACMDGNVAEVRRLVEEEGADVDKATTNGPTPLCTAAVHGHMSVVRYLVEQGADVDKARATSHTPLYGAALNGYLAVARYLVQQGADKDNAAHVGVTPLFIAAQNDHVAIVRYLAEQGADKDKARDDGWTPLLKAAQKGNEAVVRCLVDQGADKDKADCGGATPLYVAAQDGHLAVVRRLVEQGADKDKATDGGFTPLQVALSQGHAVLAAYLRAAGAR